MERVLLGKAKVCVGPNREPLRMFEAEREHRIAETLQRSLLPDRLPELPGVLLAARYVSASADMEVGGDWYDVVQLPNGQVGLAIGDVAGHGLRAASTMGQLRMGLRAYALEEPSPAKVVSRLDLLSANCSCRRSLRSSTSSWTWTPGWFSSPTPDILHRSSWGQGARPPTLKMASGLRWDATIPDPSRPASGLSPVRPSCSSPTGWWRSVESQSKRALSVWRSWRPTATRTSRRSANVIQHAYGAKEGLLEISLGPCDGTAEVTVRDQGCWRPSSGIHGGHGLPLIQELIESVEVDSGPDGTVVRMHRRISNGNGSDS